MIDDPFGPPYIGWHLQEAENGNHESARWLKDNVRAAERSGIEVDPYALWAVTDGFVRQMIKGGLRNNARRKGQVGKRGKSEFGDHNQLLFAREMWKYLHLVAGATNRKAQLHVCRTVRSSPLPSKRAARNAYYRFTKGPERRVLLAELSRDYVDQPETWLALCPDKCRLELALSKAAALRT